MAVVVVEPDPPVIGGPPGYLATVKWVESIFLSTNYVTPDLITLKAFVLKVTGVPVATSVSRVALSNTPPEAAAPSSCIQV